MTYKLNKQKLKNSMKEIRMYIISTKSISIIKSKNLRETSEYFVEFDQFYKE